jgi:hypothetical protein
MKQIKADERRPERLTDGFAGVAEKQSAKLRSQAKVEQ